ncbi:hypothetical protein B0H67DRAFT_599766 [Lasiosphaeris hirsuta]|uniref:Rhodopsin domain-containing protein n=1 Tax=Lasiosphaeris hirsuta TaxID=260670 RepID=A0AA40DXM9_9PEZI|nr:hypothetical protein B0H67DRAFT_599766 [Lasiosphaeris hirsuta]
MFTVSTALRGPSERAAKLARVHIGVTIPLLTITLIPFFARLYVRVWPVWRFGWDDGLIVAGFACAIVDWALLEGEMFMTPQEITIPQTIAAIRLAYLAIPLWGLTMTLVKTSVALTLLRLPLNHGVWKPMLYSILVAQAIYFIGDTVYIFTKCRLLYGAWDFTQTAFCDCTSVYTDMLVSSVGSAINVTTDILLSLAPMFVLWKLRRPRRERILVCCLTGMGLFASGSSIAKAVMVGKWGSAEDPWALAMSIATWTIVEQFVAVLAACGPSLKGPIQRVLGRFGILLTEYGSHISFVTIPPSRGGPPGGAWPRGLRHRYRMLRRGLRLCAKYWLGTGNTM